MARKLSTPQIEALRYLAPAPADRAGAAPKTATLRSLTARGYTREISGEAILTSEGRDALDAIDGPIRATTTVSIEPAPTQALPQDPQGHGDNCECCGETLPAQERPTEHICDDNCRANDPHGHHAPAVKRIRKASKSSGVPALDTYRTAGTATTAARTFDDLAHATTGKARDFWHLRALKARQAARTLSAAAA